jgi:hypothetical protein
VLLTGNIYCDLKQDTSIPMTQMTEPCFDTTDEEIFEDTKRVI